MKFTEERLEQVFIHKLGQQGYPHLPGSDIERRPDEVLLKKDLRAYLGSRYRGEAITENEIEAIIAQLHTLPAADLYDSNKAFCRWLSDGFSFKRHDRAAKDLYINLLDFSPANNNIYKLVNQLQIEDNKGKRIPDAILYINGLPLVVFEFKSASRENEATLHDAYRQLTVRYRRDIPQLFVYNALCVISDGVNNKMGSLFAPYEFFYAWRRVSGAEPTGKEALDCLDSMVNGLFEQSRLLQVMRDFIYFPDICHNKIKVICRYPQFYAVNKLYDNILAHKKPEGDGKGGTYFGATGCGKSFTMQFLVRRLMKSLELASPTIVLITDRTDLDDQLSQQILNAKTYIGDSTVVTVDSRADLRQQLKGRNSGGVFLTTIHKFSEDTDLLTERSNVICISDEAHRSQTNLNQKITVTKKEVRKTYGFAYYLHQSLPNATFVGFTGTPIDATMAVFGGVVDKYTMTESVHDEITVRIVYEGRAAKVIVDNRKLAEIERYYDDCAAAGANEYQIEESKKATANMSSILGDPDRIAALAQDFVQHYETRLAEGCTVKGKALFVCSERKVAWDFYRALRELRPQWFEVRECEEGAVLCDQARQKITPIERVKLVMTRGKDDQEELYNLLGSKEYRKRLDTLFKSDKSNFKIAIVVDMWLTGFDVPFLDTIYIDKPIQKHNLIQTISRVNRKYAGKERGLVVDYIGIKAKMDQALAQFSKTDEANFEDIALSVAAVREQLGLLHGMFKAFDSKSYFSDDPVAPLNCLKMAAEYVLQTEKFESTFMERVKRLKAAYNICSSSGELAQDECDYIHFYMTVRSFVFKLTKGDVPDSAQMNAKVCEMLAQAIDSDGVQEIFTLDEEDGKTIDIFDEQYMKRIGEIEMPNTRIELLKKMLAKALDEVKKTNKVRATDFSKRFQALVDKYNEREEEDVLTPEFYEQASSGFFELMADLKKEKGSFADLGISPEQKAYCDILKKAADKYSRPHEDKQLLPLANKVKELVDGQSRYPDWNNRDDIKAALKSNLIVLLMENGYPPASWDEVYKDVLEQAGYFTAHEPA